MYGQSHFSRSIVATRNLFDGHPTMGNFVSIGNARVGHGSICTAACVHTMDRMVDRHQAVW